MACSEPGETRLSQQQHRGECDDRDHGRDDVDAMQLDLWPWHRRRTTARIHGLGHLPGPRGVELLGGLDLDLARAVRAASASAVTLLGGAGLHPDLALAWLSVAGDVEVTQVVDGVVGAHIVIPRTPGLAPLLPIGT